MYLCYILYKTYFLCHRLGLFLFTRILKDGKDKRFDKAKNSPLTFMIFWTIQGKLEDVHKKENLQIYLKFFLKRVLDLCYSFTNPYAQQHFRRVDEACRYSGLCWLGHMVFGNVLRSRGRFPEIFL